MQCTKVNMLCALKVIYQLCACADTSGPTMRYLRTSQDFLYSHLKHLPFAIAGSCLSSLVTLNFFTHQMFSLSNLLSNVTGNEIAALNQMSWLMKTAAIELRVTSLNRQRSHTQRLLNLLLDDQPHMQHAGIT